MAANDAAVLRAVERQNMGLIQPECGLAILEASLIDRVGPVVALVPFNWPRVINKSKSGAWIPSILEDLRGPVEVLSHEPATDGSVQKRSEKSKQTEASLDSIKRVINEVVQEVTNSTVGENDPLMAAGLDSLVSVEFNNSLEANLAIELPSTLIFDYPTVATIAQFISKTTSRESMPGISPNHISEEILKCTHDILGDSVDLDQPLMAAGLDSLGAVELRNSIQSSLQLELPTTFVFDYPSVRSMADYVVSFVGELPEKVIEPTPSIDELAPVSRRSGLTILAEKSKMPAVSFEWKNAYCIAYTYLTIYIFLRRMLWVKVFNLLMVPRWFLWRDGTLQWRREI